MSLLHLLSASLIAATCALPAAAQSSAAPAGPAKPIPELLIPPLSTGSVPLLLQSQPPASPPLFVLPAKPPTKILSANNSGPCYTIRTYGYTPHDLESNSPKPSSYSTCTRPVANAFKGATATVTLGSPSTAK